MATYTVDRRAVVLRTTLGDDVLLVARVQGRESISGLYRFELDLLAEKGTAVPFGQLLGQEACLTIRAPDSRERHISGIISRFTEGDSNEFFTRYRLVLVPAFWLLTKRVQSRIFQQQSAPQILAEVLKGIDTAFVWSHPHRPRDYTVQYQESDFTFAGRLMEDAGIYYYFQHSADGHRMIVTDNPLQHPELEQVVPFKPAGGGRAQTDGPGITRWEKTQEVTGSKWTLRDYTFELPGKQLEAEIEVAEEAVCGATSHRLRGGYSQNLESFDGSGGYARFIDGVGPDGEDRESDLPGLFSEAQHTARLRMEEAASAGLQAEGAGDCPEFCPGYAFELSRRGDADGKYLLVEVEHEVEQSGFRSGEEQTLRYENRFTCRPVDLPYRPPRHTPRPVIAGPQTAVVVGPVDKDTYLDKYGRVKVQFHWDRHGKQDARSSCWLRVAQVWAGQRWGGFFWPRIGHEVVVAFEEGNPDRPLVVGSVYNARNMPPFEMPANGLINGIKSSSAGGKADPMSNFNGILFDDYLGKEHVEIHSERHEVQGTETSRFERVGQNLTRVVGGLPVGGSSSGGGSGDSFSNVASWRKGTIDSQLGRQFEFTVGEQAWHILGSAGHYVVGQYYNVSINPGAFLGQFGGPAPVVAAQSFLAGAQGNVSLIVGSGTALHYGPGVAVHRGGRIESHGPPHALASTLAGLVGGITIAADIAAAAQPDEAASLAFDVVAKSVQGVAMGALVSVESTLGWLKQAEVQSKHAAALAAAIPLALLIKGTAPHIVQAAVGDRIADAARAARSGDPGMLVHDCDTYALVADTHAYIASPNGAIELSGDKIDMTANQDVFLFCNQAITTWGVEHVEIHSYDVHLMGRETRSAGEMRIRDHEILLKLRENGVKLQFTLDGIHLNYPGPADPSINITSSTIELSVGASRIGLSEDGIKLEGERISLDANLMLELKAAMLEEAVQGEVNRSASLVVME